MQDQEVEKGTLLRVLRAVIEDANGGNWPDRLRHWRRVGKRFNHRLQWMDPGLGMDAHATGGVIYINDWRTRPLPTRHQQIETELRHEVIETACEWDGVPPIHYPAAWGSHHELTVELENQLLHGDELDSQPKEIR